MGLKLQRLFAAVLACMGIIILLICPAAAQTGINDGLMLCGQVIIPSLFPFMAVAGFISRTGAAGVIAYPLRPIICPLFKLTGEPCWAVLMSFIGGYPVGAAAVAQLCSQGYIDRRIASRMLTFCINAGPAMVVVAVGKIMLGSLSVGWVLYAAHIGAAILTGLIFTLADRHSEPPYKVGIAPKPQALPYAFTGAVSDASTQMLIVCGYVILFAAITAFFQQCGTPWAAVLLEVTCGARYAAQAGMSAPFISAVLGFGGLSVMCQTISLSHSLIGMGRLLLSRVINAVLSFILCSLLIRLLPDAVQTMSNIGQSTLQLAVGTIPLTLSMLIMAAVFLSSTASNV